MIDTRRTHRSGSRPPPHLRRDDLPMRGEQIADEVAVSSTRSHHASERALVQRERLESRAKGRNAGERATVSAA
ncbi:MAG: hypothetical protein R2705_13095 [Ilumatobacteraceae bacterium]